MTIPFRPFSLYLRHSFCSESEDVEGNRVKVTNLFSSFHWLAHPYFMVRGSLTCQWCLHRHWVGHLKHGDIHPDKLFLRNHQLSCSTTVPDTSFSKIIKTRYANLILSLDFTCRNQLQQTLHVCWFRQVCVSSNLLSLISCIHIEDSPWTKLLSSMSILCPFEIKSLL